MISTVTGILTDRTGETVIVQTDGGIGYAVSVPLGVFERLPAAGIRVTLFTALVVREEAWTLYGFDTPTERLVFERLLTASGFGPRLALALLSTLGPGRTVRAILDRNLAALSSVSGIGKKKAERLVLELHDKFQDLAGTLPHSPTAPPATAEAATAGLVNLGYQQAQADAAVRAALEQEEITEVATVIKRALQIINTGK